MFKKSKLLVALTLALVIGLTGITTALASGGAVEKSQAVITKLLETPYGTEIPATMTFTFDVTPESHNKDTTQASRDRAAAGLVTSEVIIAFNGEQKEKNPEAGVTTGVTTWYRESIGLFDEKEYTHTGVFEYTIEEQAENEYEIENEKYERITYSKARYTVMVYVAQGENDLEITHIGVIQTHDDDGEITNSTDKLDPSPEKEGDGKHSAMAFTNQYMKTKTPEKPGEGPDPENPNDATLFFSKEVTGNFANTEQLFNFSATITVPNLIPNFVTNTYTAYIVIEGDNNTLSRVIDRPSTVTFASNGNSGSVFSLRHGERLVFVDTPVGTNYTVSEVKTPGYKTSATVIYDSTHTIIVPAGEMGAGLILPSNNNIADKYLFASETGSSAAFLNDASGITPTGINMNNLPFIGLIAFALCGLIIFIVIKLRKKEDNT